MRRWRMSEIIELAKCQSCRYMFEPICEDPEDGAWCPFCHSNYAEIKKYRIEEVEDESS
jgi:predicted Zn-ribbon and HTH transcriptional regulator